MTRSEAYRIIEAHYGLNRTLTIAEFEDEIDNLQRKFYNGSLCDAAHALRCKLEPYFNTPDYRFTFSLNYLLDQAHMYIRDDIVEEIRRETKGDYWLMLRVIRNALRNM